MFLYVALVQDRIWQSAPYASVELTVLRRQTDPGGVEVLRKIHAGCTILMHTYPLANEWAYVPPCEWDESGVAYTNGALFFAPKGVPHGPHVAKTEVISLTIFDGPLTVA